MSFDSPLCILLLFTTWLLAWTTRRSGWFLLGASILFYTAAGWRDLALAVSLILVNYAASFLVERSRLWLAGIIAVNMGALAAFKYRALLIQDVAGFDFYTSDILIPVGISFYVFQMTAYQVDVAKGVVARQDRLDRFSLFVGLFPQLIAGPIVRARTLMPQVEQAMSGLFSAPRVPSWALALIVLGLVKKVLFADSLAPHVDAIFGLGPADFVAAWLGAWLFAFQIYFDFSGYSDIAVGMALLFGIRLPFNFRQPYLSRTPQEFWGHWHITLSTWIRDYVYIPMGGSRAGGAVRHGFVLIAAMAVAGLWHGANTTFILWGVAWGATIVFWRYAGGVLAWLSWGQWLLLLIVTTLLWVLFRAPSIDFASDYLAVMFGAAPLGTWRLPGDAALAAWVAAGCACLMALHGLERWLFSRKVARSLARFDSPVTWGFLVALIVWIVVMPDLHHNPFIYFRF